MERRQRPIGWSANFRSLQPIRSFGFPWLESATAGAGWASRGEGSPDGFAFVKVRQRMGLALAPGRFGKKYKCRQLSTTLNELD